MLQSEAQQKHQADVLENVGRVSLLMSFKLADLVNIALEEGSYFRSKEWREQQKGKLLVEHSQEEWQKSFFTAVSELRTLETTGKTKEPYQSDKFEPIVQFFKTLKTQEPILSSKPEPVHQAV